jgi:hypothetical protein
MANNTNVTSIATHQSSMDMLLGRSLTLDQNVVTMTPSLSSSSSSSSSSVASVIAAHHAAAAAAAVATATGLTLPPNLITSGITSNHTVMPLSAPVAPVISTGASMAAAAAVFHEPLPVLHDMDPSTDTSSSSNDKKSTPRANRR